jgi:uncharacterized protein YbjT (DUF2867 family)
VVLVLGATGYQGGATARALRGDGWQVRALVRDPASENARALAALGVELVRGDMRDRASLERAAAGAHGVFSVQPSSGQPSYGVTDEDETRFGMDLVDVARAAGVKHFVYTSVAGLEPGLGLGHYESKWRIEEHVRASGLRYTILRPGGFMEILLQPFCGLSAGHLQFVIAPDQPFQIIATRDIGIFAAKVFADPARHAGTTFEIVGDELTGRQIAEKISRAVGRTLEYSRVPPELQAQVPMLKRLVELVDEGKIMGHANIAQLRELHPDLFTFDRWLASGGADEIAKLLPA